MIYTEIEQHQASPRERWSVFSLVWHTAGDPDIPSSKRRKLRRMAIRHYLTLHPRVSSYLVNRNGDA